MGAGVNKVYLEIRGRHILDYSVETVIGCDDVVTDLVLVHRRDDTDQIDRVVAAIGERSSHLAVHTTLGGDTRHESEYTGVSALRSQIEAGRLDVVAVHDGARPFMGRELLIRSLTEAARHDAVIPGLAVTDELYAMDRGGFVDPHDHVWVQTPQAFDAATLLKAHDAAAAAGFRGVDTAEVVQYVTDTPVRVISGHDANIKVTYRTDLVTAETLAAAWEADHSRQGPPEPPAAGA